MVVEFTTKCFAWQWNTPHSDKTLHLSSSRDLIDLLGWLDQDPHLISPGKLVNRESLLQICLGLGLLLRDANLIQFTEDNRYPDETPDYIVQSIWETRELDAFTGYVKRLWTDINKSLTR